MSSPNGNNSMLEELLEKPHKAHILKHDSNGNISYNDPIEVLYNPQQYSIDKSNQFASMAIPGTESPIIQFIRGESETLSIELFFDTYTYHEGKDVREYTNKLKNLLKIEDAIHAPPVCSFVWGRSIQDEPFFTGIIEKISTTYTMFLRDGTPVRAKVNFSLRQYQYSENKTRVESPDKTKRTVLTSGESLWLLAAREYGDPSKWREIANANNIDDPLEVQSGRELVIPKL